jgi:hypothetical protein
MQRTAMLIATRGITHVECSIAIRLAQTGQWHVTILAPESSSIIEHAHLHKLLGNVSGVSRVATDYSPRATDALFFRLNDSLANALPWFACAGRVIGISSSDFSKNPKAAAGVLWRTFRRAARCDTIVAESRSTRWNPYRVWKRTVLFEPSVHPDFWLRAELAALMSIPPPEPDAHRKFRLMFAGNCTPASRVAALQSAIEAINEAKIPSEQYFWLVYGAPNEARSALLPANYLGTLDDSDFTVSPPGWYPWTHRLVEAVARHSIPIADMNECRAFGLKDGEMAVGVRRNDWAGAVRRALGLPFEVVARMRRSLARRKAAARHAFRKEPCRERVH